MKQVGGVWLPDHERHLIEWMNHPKNKRRVDGKLAYQYPKLLAALKWVKEWRVAVDIGAHCGLWSMHLTKKFATVHAFEPVEAHRECFARNVPVLNEGQVMLYAAALGDHDGSIAIATSDGSSGDSHVAGDGDIPLRRLDDYRIENVDFIKLDCEGYELFALKGAEETLKRCRPCINVEQKPGRAEQFGLPRTEAVTYLQSLGAKLRCEMSGDYCLSWD